MDGLSLVSYTMKDIITKAEAWCIQFDDFIGARVFDDSKIRMYSYSSETTYSKLGDVVIFEKGFLNWPKLRFIANKTENGWCLKYFKYGKWCDHLIKVIN